MKILYFCWEYPPNGSGIGRSIAEMAEALGEAGHQVIVMTSYARGLPSEETIRNMLILRNFDRSEIRSERVAKQALEVASSHQVDWIEVPDHWGEGATILRHRQRPLVVIKMHYNDVLKRPRYAQAWYSWQRVTINLACLRQWRSLRAEKFSIENADILLAPCEQIFEEVRRDGLRMPVRCGVVPNAIRCPADWNNAESDHPTLLIAGRLDIGKGLPYLRGLLERLVPIFPGLRLQMAGGDSYARGLGSIRRWLLNQLGPLQASVDLLGPLKPQELDAAFRRAWIVLLPSRWDTFPLVVLESMARAKPIVASPNGGMPEMLRDTENVVEDPASPAFGAAIEQLLLDSEKRLRAGQSGYRRARQVYSHRRVAEEYVRTIRSLL